MQKFRFINYFWFKKSRLIYLVSWQRQMRYKTLKILIYIILIVILVSISNQYVNFKKFQKLVPILNQTSNFEFKINKSKLLVNKRIDSCLNDVAAKNNLAFVTLAIADHPDYVKSAAKLLKTVIKNTHGVKYDKILIELKEKPLDSNLKQVLIRSGWDFVCTVNRIGPIKDTGTIKTYRDLFTKLIIFNMTQYEGIVTMDADTIVIGNITELFYLYKKIDFLKYYIAVGPDIDFHTRYDTIIRFNAGIFIVRPNGTEFKRLMSLKKEKSLHLDPYFAEQTFLNHWYAAKWYNFGYKYNCIIWHLKYYKYNVSLIPKDIHVIHFTNLKPWNCIPEAVEICNLWKNIPV